MERARETKFSILVLTEDAGKDAHATVEALGKKLLRLVDEQCQTHRARFEPANDAARAATHANRWKSPNHHRERVALVRTIATKILEARGFVFFHVDGDRVWSQQHTSENREKFQRLIVGHVRALLAEGGARKQGMAEPDIERALERLFLLMPFYSIEAWLYQNTDKAEELCRKHYRGKHAEQFQRWCEHRHEIDELDKPKDNVCLAAKHNLELAQSAYPAQDAYGAGTSLASAVDTLCACADLKAALAETNERLDPGT